MKLTSIDVKPLQGENGLDSWAKDKQSMAYDCYFVKLYFDKISIFGIRKKPSWIRWLSLIISLLKTRIQESTSPPHGERPEISQISTLHCI